MENCLTPSIEQTLPKLVPTFSDLIPFLNRHSSPASLAYDEAEAYYDVIQKLPEGATLLEIGCQFGRSSAIAAWSSRNFRLLFVDPFAENNTIFDCWKSTMAEIGVPYTHYPFYSNSPFIPRSELDLVLIDAAHEYGCVVNDCRKFVPWVKRGGYAVFHDYGRPDTNGVQQAVDEDKLLAAEFDRISLTGTLLIWRRR